MMSDTGLIDYAVLFSITVNYSESVNIMKEGCSFTKKVACSG
jgi:hypothetical protein